MKKFCLLFLIVFLFLISSCDYEFELINGTSETTSINEDSILIRKLCYEETNDRINNPGSGFYTPVYLSFTMDKVNGFENLENDFYLLNFDLSIFSKKTNKKEDLEISKSSLESFDKNLKKLDKKGATAIVKFSYDNFKNIANMEPDINFVKSHIVSLAKILSKYDNLIYGIECGMIGSSGSMEESDCVDMTNVRTIIDTWYKNTELIILIPKAKYLYNYLGYTKETVSKLNDNHYNISRFGIYNSSCLSEKSKSFDDYSTEKNILKRTHLLYGGIVCDNCNNLELLDDNTLNKIKDCHLSFLSKKSDPELLKEWMNTSIHIGDRNISKYNYLSNHMGCQLKIEKFDVTRKKNSIEVEIDFIHSGFYNKFMKNLYYSLIIKNESKQFAYQDALDNLNIKQDFYDIDSGEYDIYLKIYDSDKKRSFRIINDTSFEDGKNYLGKIKIN